MLSSLVSTILAIIAITNADTRRLLTPQDSSCSSTPSPSTFQCDPNKATTTAGAAGDPHWTTFGGWQHHFQGDIPLFYYLMTPCKAKGIGHNKINGLPWNLVVRVDGSSGNNVKWIRDTILESVDEDDGKIYYLYVRNNPPETIVGSYHRNINDQDIIEIGDAMKQLTWARVSPTTTALTVNLGSDRTASIYMDGNYVRVQFRIPSGCTNDSGPVLDYKVYYTVIHVEAPPICYRCATCGLLGDFYEPTGYLLNPYGKHCYILNKYEYQNLGFMEQTTATPKPTSSPSAPPPGTTQFGSPINCDSDRTTKARVIDAVDIAYQQYVQNRECCNGTRAVDCNDEKQNSITDVCNYFKDTHATDAQLAAQTYKETAANLEAQCLQHNACAGHDTKKYVFINEEKNWDAAENYCKNECDTELAIITTTEANIAAVNACKATYCWFGLRRYSSDPTKWWWHKRQNGVLNKTQWNSPGYTFESWAPDEPSNGTKQLSTGEIIIWELCGEIDNTRGGKWNDIRCPSGNKKAFLCENPHYTGTTANMINNDIDINMNAGKIRRPRGGRPNKQQRPKPPRNQRKGSKKGKRNNANDIDIENNDDMDNARSVNNIKTVKDNGNNGYYTGSLMKKWFIIGLLFGVLITFCIGGPLNMLYKSINNKKHQYKPVMEISSSDQSDDDTKNIL